MAMNEEVRAILFDQLDALHVRSTEKGIPLIAMDGLSGTMAAIGEILLNEDEETFAELSGLRETVRKARQKAQEIREYIAESGCTECGILALLDELQNLPGLQREDA